VIELVKVTLIVCQSVSKTKTKEQKIVMGPTESTTNLPLVVHCVDETVILSVSAHSNCWV